MAEAPVAMMTAVGQILVRPGPDPNRRAEKSTLVTSDVQQTGAEALGLLAEPLHQLGAEDPVGKPG